MRAKLAAMVREAMKPVFRLRCFKNMEDFKHDRPHFELPFEGLEDFLSFGLEAEGGRRPFTTTISLQPLLKELRRLKASDSSRHFFAEEVIRLIEAAPDLMQPTLSAETLQNHPQLLEVLLQGFFPALREEWRLGYINPPLDYRYMFATQALKELLESEQVEIQMWETKEQLWRKLVLNACRLVLMRCYDQQLGPILPPVVTTWNKETQLETHLNVNITDFVEPHVQGELPDLSEAQIRDLLQHPYDLDRWLAVVPVDRFEFRGLVFVYLTDVTEQEAISRLKNRLLGHRDHPMYDDMHFMRRQLRSFFKIPQLEVGISGTDTFFEELPRAFHDKKPSLLADQVELLHGPALKASVYERAVESEAPVVIEDIEAQSHIDPLQQALWANGYRSVLLCPIKIEDRLLGVMELGAPEPDIFGQETILKLQELLPLLTAGFARKREELENRIRDIMQQQFTNIHPSVYWRFREASVNLLREKERPDRPGRIDVEPIVFKQVYPLYGQVDIVSSSVRRNELIQQDMIANLEMMLNILQELQASREDHLIKHYQTKVRALNQKIIEHFSSSDETRILELFAADLHPFLKTLKQEVSPELRQRIEHYFAALDGHLEFVYERRKAFEDSIAMVNDAIAKYLEKENQRMQHYLPHYFERYSTDGVEYNLYLGQSLLKKRPFYHHHLREFRLWQLVNMCEIVRRLETLKSQLPIPLETAQLIFVYSDPLDIRFRQDEKQFDVDGAYNVRYEILKKRIDKAYVEGGKERLTQQGKIALVYLNRKDRNEYLEFFDYLRSEGYLTEEVEDLELDSLQGVEGLRALRVTVRHL